MSEIKLIVADDHPIFRQGLQNILEMESSFRVLHLARNGVEALQRAAEEAPDVMILDVSMPAMGGLEVAAKRHSDGLPFELILLTMHDDRETFARAMDLGVKGHWNLASRDTCSRTTPVTTLFAASRRFSRGRRS